MSDRDLQENEQQPTTEQFEDHTQPSSEPQPHSQPSPQPSPQSYPTFQSISQQINLLELQDPPQIPHPVPNPPFFTQIQISKTDNPSLLDLQSIDININDHNTNLLDIAGNDNSSEIIKFLDGREITIDDQMEVISEGYITSYKLYTIYSKSKYTGDTTEVKRRFSDFQFLQQLLFDLYPGRIIPVLPEKNFWASLNMQGKDYSIQRIKRLKKYLDSLLMNEKLRVTPQLRLFLFDGSAEFSEMKGEYEEKSKIEDKVKTVAGRVYEMGKEFISSLVTKGSSNEAKCLSIEYISKDNIQITELCLKLKTLYQSIHKLKPEISNKIKQFDLISGLSKSYLTINVNTRQINDQLKQCFQDTQYYIQSCWEALDRYGKLYEELEALKKEEQGMMKKYRDNPRSKDMDLLKTKTKRLSEKLERSNTILQEEIKIGTLRAEFLFKSLLDLYLKYRRIQYM